MSTVRDSGPSIKPGVFFAPSGRHGVLMDLATNRYLAISATSRAIWTALEDHATPTAIAAEYAARHTVDLAEARTIVDAQFRAWREADLLVEGRHGTPAVLPIAKPSGTPASQAFDRHRIDTTRVSLITVARMIWTRRDWDRRLLRDGLAATLVRLQRARAQTPRLADRAEHVIARVMRAYYAARLPFRQGTNDCLLRAIALASLLRSCGDDVDLCIGIKAMPFSAHSWVEWRGLLLNEIPTALDGFVIVGRF